MAFGTATTQEVLNPTLYRALQRKFGEVDVVAPGHAIVWKKVPIPRGRGRRKFRREVTYSGEEYRIRCPFCRDHRPRLYINHRWGVWDEETQSYNLFLANCFNEGCLEDFQSQRQLYERVYLPSGQWNRKIRVRRGVTVRSGELVEIPDPGPLVRLDDLAAEQPQHHAIEYLRSRDLDPVKLGRRWGVSYCSWSRYPMASDRIIIPVRMGGIQVGWQARFIGDDFGGCPLNDAKIPKYWTSPGMPRRLVAYNFDQAIRHRTVVIVEGPPDVWAGGARYMGLLGKTMSPQLQARFLAAMRNRHGDGFTVVIMLDPKQDERARQRGRAHHIAALKQQLEAHLPGRICEVYLKGFKDPGKVGSPQKLRRIVQEEAARQGVPVYFQRPRG